jgi:hypothetical protein
MKNILQFLQWFDWHPEPVRVSDEWWFIIKENILIIDAGETPFERMKLIKQWVNILFEREMCFVKLALVGWQPAKSSRVICPCVNGGRRRIFPQSAPGHYSILQNHACQSTSYRIYITVVTIFVPGMPANWGFPEVHEVIYAILSNTGTN